MRESGKLRELAQALWVTLEWLEVPMRESEKFREMVKRALGLTDEDLDQIQRDSDACCGSIDEPGLKIAFHGACPVQGTGTVDGFRCEYHARCGGSFTVYDAGGECIWTTEFEDADGWDKAAVTAENIRSAVAKFRDRTNRRHP